MADELERVRKALRELGKSLESLHGDSAPKDVHKLRTASRRVEAIAGVLRAADGKKSRRLVKAIEPVRKAAGGVRDMDVLLTDARRLARYCDGESLNRLVAHLKTARQQNAAEMQHALHHRRKAILEDLKEYPKFVASVAKHAQRSDEQAGTGAGRNQQHRHEHDARARRLEAPRCRESACVPAEGKAAALHSCNWTHEADTGLVEALGEVQRRVGDWHDWHQLEEIAHGVLDARRRRRAARPHP